MTPGRPDYLKPILLGGLIGGAIISVPPLCCCCCFQFLVPGFIAAYFLAQVEGPRAGVYVDASQGALVGIGGGAAGALLHWILTSMWQAFTHSSRLFDPSELLSRIPDSGNDENLRWLIDLVQQQQHQPLLQILGIRFVVSLLLGVMFGALGGVLGVLVFRKPLPASPPPVAAPMTEAPPAWSPPAPPAPPPPPADDASRWSPPGGEGGGN